MQTIPPVDPVRETTLDVQDLVVEVLTESGWSTVVDAPETYVEASRSIGSPTRLILTRHVFPNTLAPLTVQMAVTAGYAMLAEAGLSFLGLGVQPPDASWGTMIREGFLYFSLSPYLGIFPGIMIAITVFTFVTLGDGLRDALGREERRER